MSIEIPYGGMTDELMKKLNAQPSQLFVIWVRNSGKLVRVVECQPHMVSMSGSWSNQYEYAEWSTIYSMIKASEATTKLDKKEQI